jgi:phenylpyruvate tautomerase PptA (4-oxalocrotonate tautomerase family)
MPLVKISIRTGKSPGYKRALLNGVHAALVEAFLIPDADRHQQLFELDADHFEIPSTKSEAFVLVEIIAFQGRSIEAKRKLYAAIVRNFGNSPGIAGDDVMIILHEPPKENWGLRGGRPASDVDIGFKVDV